MCAEGSSCPGGDAWEHPGGRASPVRVGALIVKCTASLRLLVLLFVVDVQPAVRAVGLGARAHGVMVAGGARESPPPEPDSWLLVVDAGAEGGVAVGRAGLGTPPQGEVATLGGADRRGCGVVLREQLLPRFAEAFAAQTIG